MKLSPINRRLISSAIFVVLSIFACSFGGCPSSPTQGPLIPNALPISVSQGPSSHLTVNMPYTSVTVCVAPLPGAPPTPICQEVNDILVDTGSTGLRIFKQALNARLAPPAGGVGTAEYEMFASGNAWGPVVLRSVVLGGEPAVQVPIQVIDSSFGGGVPQGYASSWGSPDDAGFNGILGVSVMSPSDSGQYYSCESGACSFLTAPTGQPNVENPVCALPKDNNGVIISMSAIQPGGQSTASGSLFLGIGTELDNDPRTFSSNWLFSVPATGSILAGNAGVTMTVGGQSFDSLLPDSGTNAIVFDDSAIPGGDVGLNGFYCLPPSMQSFSAAISAPGGNWNFTFSVACFQVLPSNCVVNPAPGETACFSAFDNVATPATPYVGQFVFGLPLFYGRDVYLVYPNASAPPPLGNGPFYGFGGH
jgi:hypothetical protein